MVLHPLNFYAGWGLVLGGLLTGAVLGLFFHREEFWGGYASFRRRIARLGHIALVALGMLNVLVSVAVPESAWQGRASVLFVVGGLTMPAVCFLSTWRSGFRHLFFIPVSSLLAAVICVLVGGAL